jgi:hypothetical protein
MPVHMPISLLVAEAEQVQPLGRAHLLDGLADAAQSMLQPTGTPFRRDPQSPARRGGLLHAVHQWRYRPAWPIRRPYSSSYRRSRWKQQGDRLPQVASGDVLRSHPRACANAPSPPEGRRELPAWRRSATSSRRDGAGRTCALEHDLPFGRCGQTIRRRPVPMGRRQPAAPHDWPALGQQRTVR